jgi:uncharacterized membrane protein
MTQVHQIPTTRIEALSDGVIAIIITVMVFDLKLQEIPTEVNIWPALGHLLPKIISYVLSFLMLAIMWVNHHQLFHQIGHATRGLLWYNIHLLFWMSLVPFVTNFIGANPMLWQSSFFYGIIFFMNAFSFTMLRDHVVTQGLLHEAIDKRAHDTIRHKNRLALLLYAFAAVTSMASVYISFVLFLTVPAMYLVPERIVLREKQ